MVDGQLRITIPSRKQVPAIYLMCDCVPRDVCYMWDRVHRDVCLCACVRGRVQNPHVHGDVKNRNPSRKHILFLYLMCDRVDV